MQNKYASPGLRLGLAGRTPVVVAACLSLMPVGASAWTRASHAELAATAARQAPAFRAYAEQHGLLGAVVQQVQDADNEPEKVFTADLEKTYPGITMIKGDDPTKVQHTSPVLAYFLPEDTRFHNALGCLKIARGLRSRATGPEEHRAAMRIFGDGLHLVQDYFAHLNAPGRGQTGFSHGVGNLIDTDGDGTPDRPAGRVVDNVDWDCHSDHGNDAVPTQLRVINYFHSPFWHHYAAKEDTWRYQAALHAGIEYMECYLAEDGVTRFGQVLARGHVTHDGKRTYLDLITHLVADNREASCQLTGDWEHAALPGSFMADSAVATVQPAGTAATWTLTCPLTGDYDLYLRWPQDAQLTANATVKVRSGGKAEQHSANQRTNANRWNRLGRWSLSRDDALAVTLTAAEGERIAADAVMWVRVTD